MNRIKEIIKREAKATKGPWEVREFENLKGWIERTIYQPGPSDFKDQDNEHDFIFIAHARDDVPWLIAEVERLRGLVKTTEYEQEYGRCHFCNASDVHERTCEAFNPDGTVK